MRLRPCPSARPGPRPSAIRVGRRAVPLGLALASVAVTLASAGPAGATAPEARRIGGSVVVYSGRNEALVEPLFAEFTERTGVEVEVRYGDSGALASQLLTEADASPADLFFSQDAGALGALAKERRFTKLPRATLDRVPAAYRATDGTWVGVSGRVRVVVYNPTLVAKPPTTIDQIVDPRWKGRIGYAPTNASWQAFVTGLRVLRGEVKAEKWLRAFAANEPVAYANNGAVRDAVDDGQIALGLVNHYYLWQRLAVEGEAAVTARNQFLAAGDPGGLVNVAGAGILRTAENRRAALALVDFLLSERGQEYFAESTYEYPLVPGIPTSVKLPRLETLSPPEVDLSDLDSLAATQALLVKVGLLTR